MTQRNLLFAAIACTLAFSPACGHKKIQYGEQAVASSEKNGKGVQAKVIWLKNKKDAIDLRLAISNQYDFPIQVLCQRMKMTFEGRTGEQGRCDLDSFGFDPGVSRNGLISFKFGNPKLPKNGTAEITIPFAKASGEELTPIVLRLPTTN